MIQFCHKLSIQKLINQKKYAENLKKNTKLSQILNKVPKYLKSIIIKINQVKDCQIYYKTRMKQKRDPNCSQKSKKTVKSAKTIVPHGKMAKLDRNII